MKEKSGHKTVDSHDKNYLTEPEIKKFLEATKKSRHSVRDFATIVYRQGLRVSELVALRLKDIDLNAGRIFVKRVKGSLSTHQPIDGDELRAIRAWLRQRGTFPNAHSNYLFLSERGPPTRQATNYLVKQIGRPRETGVQRESAYAPAFYGVLSCEPRL